MSQRIFRTVPAALLMTTALAWNLPAAAQGIGNAPGGAATGTVQPAPAPADARPTGEAAPRDSGGTSSGQGAFGGRGLPADLTPAMPDRAASAPDQGKPAEPPKPSAGPTKP